jgi:DNA-binding CsgD family transcriptional regulator
LKKTLQIVFILFFTSNLIAQEIVPLQNYSPEIYGAENQNWSASQDSKKNIYVANNSGLLEYNGAKWQLYPSPNNSVIRSVSVIQDKIYTGCHMEFGVWEKDEFGKLFYSSISAKLKQPILEDEEIWNIVEFEKWILFQSLNRIYIYNTVDENFKIINSNTVLQKVFKLNKKIYFQNIEEGLYKINNGKAVLVSDDEILKKNIIVNMYSDVNSILILTQKKGFYSLDNKNILNKWNCEDEPIFEKISVYSSIKMFDGSYVLGTISNGVYLLNKNGKILENINQEKGLYNSTILHVFEDLDHNIWAALDNGICVLNFNSPYKVYNDINGKLGTVYASTIFKNKLYLGTNQGLFSKNLNSRENFSKVLGSQGQVWSLTKYDNQLFCGHNNGTFLVESEGLKEIANIPGTWSVKTIPNKPNLLIQGNYDGLNILEKKNGTWNYRNKIEGFDNSSRFFELEKNGDIVVNHELKGVFKLKANPDFTKIIDFKIDKTKKGAKSSLVKYDNKIFFSFKNGVFSYHPKKKDFLIDHFLSDGVIKDETYISGKLVSTEGSKLWGFSNDNIIYFAPGKINTTPEVHKIPLPSVIRRDFSGFENVSHINEEKYIFGSSYGYMTIDLEKILPKKHTIEINNIFAGPLIEPNIPVKLKGNNSFKYNDHNLSFNYSVANYDKYARVVYQYKLTGIYDDWSEWTTTPHTSFNNLPYGAYSFKTRAKVGNSVTKNIAEYNFIIERPWYIANKMLILYFIISMILIIFIHRSYQLHFKRQKRILLEKKQREFERSQLENETEIVKLRNEKLRHDIDSKNRELAASTMSIIKKNEFLNTIKKELSEVKNNEYVQPIIKIIDKNLNHTSNWELFQEAFNNADKDFLKKVKEKHPSLTPNDLRLCAYLRLNLSSKEIAPLLNISHKSVEIKRYRLRKKMGLGTKDNLIHHILEI